MNSNIWGDFQICISVPLKKFDRMFQPAIPIVGQRNNPRAHVCICKSYTLRVRVSLHRRTIEKSFMYFLFCDVALSHW